MILTTVNIEDAPENIRKPLGLLTGEAQDLFCAWTIFKDISIEVPETIALINKTPPFFFIRVQNILFEHLIIGAARLTDPPSQSGHHNLTLHDLFDGQKPTQLVELEAMAGNIREIRRKIVGHLDYKCGIDPSSLPNKGIIAKIRKSLELIDEILQLAWERWTGNIYTISSMGATETNEILKCLQKAEIYNRLEKNKAVPEGLWNYPEDLIQNYLGTLPQAWKDS
jgi:HEPN superfamily AbiU2-like protein